MAFNRLDDSDLNILWFPTGSGYVSILERTASEWSDTMVLRGWARLDGQMLSEVQFGTLVRERREGIEKVEGEFFFQDGTCRARDWFGVIPGSCPPATIACEGLPHIRIEPDPGESTLEEAIRDAVELRSGCGVTALSGGVDSALVAVLAGLPCITVGFPESHDIRHGLEVASRLGLECEPFILEDRIVEEHLPLIVRLSSTDNPVDIGIAATQFFIALCAHDLGHERILSGQGADEQFGGYSRYLSSSDLATDLDMDLRRIIYQVERDQRIAAHFGCYFSLPYLDARVVRAAAAIPAHEKIRGGTRKYPLREVARRYIPSDVAWYEKKAMQYGSGIWSCFRRLARHNGYKTSLKDYVNHLKRVE